MSNGFVQNSKDAIPIQIIFHNEYVDWLKKQNQQLKNWLLSTNFKGQAGNMCLIPNSSGKLNKVIFCLSNDRAFWSIGSLPFNLPEGVYRLDDVRDNETFENYALAWGLGSYQFTHYKRPLRKPAQLLFSKKILSFEKVVSSVEAIYLVRDLINTPTEELGPSEFSVFVKKFCSKYKATFKQIVGDDLLKYNYPMIHAVGRACDDEPRLIDIRWGNKKNPLVTLVGKGVCFDTGGLDIKSSAGMLLMKKDMGGAAHVLGLAQMIIQAKLPINLRVLIPVVENSVSGNAYRPGDVIKSRKGITVEIGNTDAEGRLILADALTEAVSDTPDLLIDIATLTGAARIALGTELPAMFCNDETVANNVLKCSVNTNDLMWRLPLFAAYRESINSSIADINNAGSDSYGGAITAALFLQEFVPNEIPWMHFDLMAWNLKTRPGKPQGGEAMAIRGLFDYLKNRYT